MGIACSVRELCPGGRAVSAARQAPGGQAMLRLVANAHGGMARDDGDEQTASITEL
jgi:hypothetical protein